MCERNNSVDTNRSVKEREKVLQVLGKIPLQDHGEDPSEAAVPLQSLEVHGGAGVHLQPLQTHPHWSSLASPSSVLLSVSVSNHTDLSTVIRLQTPESSPALVYP